ncbi:hypothetical protein BC831DRAFT_477267 [Entophlyctis helioformis]|nr:hypothetical protein BC831DRAFT_477267 [Entophlyctis helioformis]
MRLAVSAMAVMAATVLGCGGCARSARLAGRDSVGNGRRVSIDKRHSVSGNSGTTGCTDLATQLAADTAGTCILSTLACNTVTCFMGGRIPATGDISFTFSVCNASLAVDTFTDRRVVAVGTPSSASASGSASDPASTYMSIATTSDGPLVRLRLGAVSTSTADNTTIATWTVALDSGGLVFGPYTVSALGNRIYCPPAAIGWPPRTVLALVSGAVLGALVFAVLCWSARKNCVLGSLKARRTGSGRGGSGGGQFETQAQWINHQVAVLASQGPVDAPSALDPPRPLSPTGHLQ